MNSLMQVCIYAECGELFVDILYALLSQACQVG